MNKISRASDIYSFGMVITLILNSSFYSQKTDACFPHNLSELIELIKKGLDKEAAFHEAICYFAHFSRLSNKDVQQLKSWINLAATMLSVEPEQRPTIERVIQHINDICAQAVSAFATTVNIDSCDPTPMDVDSDFNDSYIGTPMEVDECVIASGNASSISTRY